MKEAISRSREEPTCEESGHVAGYTCVKCNTHFSDPACTQEISEKDWVLPALGHDWDNPTYTWADDNSTADAKHTCKRDDSHVEEESVTTSSRETAATCTMPSATVYIAEFENPAFDAQIKRIEGTDPPIGHNWGNPTYLWASDNSTVTAKRICANDNNHVDSIAVNTTSEIKEGEEPTCTETGTATFTADFSSYGDPYATQTKTDAVPALGHDWGAWVTVKAPTTSEKGTKERTCKRDTAHKETAEIPALTPAPSDITPANTTPAAAPLLYHIVEGAGASYAKNSRSPLVFTYKRTYDDPVTFSHFTGLEIDGLWLDASHYTAAAGSVVITLKADYLETLEIGRHTITAYFDDGNAVTADFYVGTRRTNRIPNTEDHNRMQMWAMIEFYSIAVSLIIIHKLRTTS